MPKNFRVFLISVAVFGSACAIKPYRLPLDAYWPPAPEPPRIQYLETFVGSPYYAPAFSDAFVDSILGGGQANLLFKPTSVVADDKGNVYVTDVPGRVFVLDREKETVRLIADKGQARILGVGGLAFHNARNELYASDSERKSVLVIDPQRNELVRQYSGDFTRPVGVAIDEGKDRLAVVDIGQHKVYVLAAKTGEALYAIGRRGSEDGEFNFPTAAAYGGDGRLYVTDSMNFRIQVFDDEGKFVLSFGSLGLGSGQFSRPKGVGVDSEGHVYVVDAAFGNVQIFDGETGDHLLAFGQGGFEPGEFSLPHGLFVDGSNRIYVVDQSNKRVQIFQYIKAADSKRIAEERKAQPAPPPVKDQ